MRCKVLGGISRASLPKLPLIFYFDRDLDSNAGLVMIPRGRNEVPEVTLLWSMVLGSSKSSEFWVYSVVVSDYV